MWLRFLYLLFINYGGETKMKMKMKRAECSDRTSCFVMPVVSKMVPDFPKTCGKEL